MKENKKEYAKIVYDWETDTTFNRTEKTSRLKFDIDFFGREKWNYDSSHNSFEKCKGFALKVLKLEGVSSIRVVESKTGEILFKK